MASSSRIPPNVDDKSARLLERAYALSGDADARELYRDWAETYDRTMLDDHVPDKTVPVLDVGAGTGLAGQELAASGFTSIDAVDYSSDMLAVAARRAIYKDLIEADLTKPLDIADATYGAAVCTGTFTHGHVSPRAACSRFRSILGSGSREALKPN